MIRIDEIYSNVFLPRVQGKRTVGLHWFDPFGSVDIRDMVNLPPIDGRAETRIVFWDQEPLQRNIFMAFMDQFAPVYEGPLLLVTSEQASDEVAWARDTYGLDSTYYFFHGWAALDWYRGYNHSFLWPDWNTRTIQRRLFCPNNIIGGTRQHRLRLVSGMAEKQLLEGNYISCPDRCPFSLESAADICDNLGIDRIQGLPFMIDQSTNHAKDSHRIDFGQHAIECFCHVVTETVYEGNKLHLTEKTFKPIVLQQPFVLVAPRGSLAYMRSYGFKTFDHIWDESYDTLDDNHRLAAILELLQQINSWSSQTMEQNQSKISEVVLFNYAWFYGGFQDMLWRELCDMVQHW
jgi:hypothetical protein